MISPRGRRLGGFPGAAVASCDGRLHPVCVLWDVSVLVALPAYLVDGRSSVRGFAEAVGLTTVAWDSRFAPAFKNINTPTDLDRLVQSTFRLQRPPVPGEGRDTSVAPPSRSGNPRVADGGMAQWVFPARPDRRRVAA